MIIILLLAITQFVFNIFIGKPTTLSCGLAGFYPKKNKRVDIQKLFMLGIMNEERGTDSTGLTIGSVKFAGINTLKKCRDFISENMEDILKENTRNKPCILHTRKSTVGANNIANCHPFLYSNKSDGNYKFVIAHNGVISNTAKIKEKFLSHIEDVEKSLFIDTHYIGLSLAQSFKGTCNENEVLKFYEGHAALLYYDTNGTFKAWKGASNNLEERPLYYIETKDGWYFCSIESSLKIVFENKYDIHSLNNNELLTFYDGKFEDSQIIERKHNLYPATHNSKANNYHYDRNYYYEEETWDDYDYNTKYFRKEAVRKKENTNYSPSTFNSPLLHPVVNLSSLLYTDRHDIKNPITGEYKVASNPISANKIYSLFSNKSTYSDKILFHNGILVRDVNIFKAIKNKFNVKDYPTVDKFFNGEINRIRNVIVDFIPFFDEFGVHTVVYKSNHNALGYDYISKYDKKTVIIDTKFSSQNICIKADSDKFFINAVNSYLNAYS